MSLRREQALSSRSAEATQAAPLVRLSWTRTDDHAVVTRVAVAGALAAVALALWGLPPVDLHGPLHRFGIMDFLCGGTRAAHFTVTGDWALAWYYNPLGPLAVIGAGLMVLRTIIGLTARRWLNVTVAWTSRHLRTAFAIWAVAVAALTIRQQLMVDVLM